MSGTLMLSELPLALDAELPPIFLLDSATFQPRPTRNKTDEAALRLLLTNDADAYEYLVRICHLGCYPYYIRDRGISKREATDKFLRDWLTFKLAPYFVATATDIEAAVNAGKFRHIKRQVRSAVIDRLRKLNRSREPLERHNTVRIDLPLTADEEHPLRREMLATAEDGVYVSSLGKSPAVWPSELARVLESDDLEDGLGPQLYRVLLAICDLFPDRLSIKGDIVRAIAASERVSEQTARRLLGSLQTKMAELSGGFATQNLYELLTRPERQSCFWQ